MSALALAERSTIEGVKLNASETQTETPVDETPEAPAEEQTDEEQTEDEQPAEHVDETSEVEAPKAELPFWRHKPTVAYVDMVVARREAKGDLSATALAKFRTALFVKHGLPTTKAAQAKYTQQVEAAKKALKTEAKEARRTARLEARAAKKAEAAA